LAREIPPRASLVELVYRRRNNQSKRVRDAAAFDRFAQAELLGGKARCPHGLHKHSRIDFHVLNAAVRIDG